MQAKHNRWVYVALVVMILALIGFSGLPLVSSIFQASYSQANTVSTPGISQQLQAQLESQAKGYKTVLEREPDNETALRGLLEIRLKQGKIEAAIEPLEKLAELNNNLTDYRVLLAQAKQQVKDYEGSAAAYRQILADRPGNLPALGGMIQLLLAQNRPEGAIGLLEDTLKQAKQSQSETESFDLSSIQLILGEVYTKLKRYQEAIAIYDRVAQENQEDFRPLLSKALVFKEQGKKEEAKSLLDSALSLAPAMYKDQIKAISATFTQAIEQK